MGEALVNEDRPCPMCSSTRWIRLEGTSHLQALEGGLHAIALSCDDCGFIRWHRLDRAERA